MAWTWFSHSPTTSILGCLHSGSQPEQEDYGVIQRTAAAEWDLVVFNYWPAPLGSHDYLLVPAGKAEKGPRPVNCGVVRAIFSM